MGFLKHNSVLRNEFRGYVAVAFAVVVVAVTEDFARYAVVIGLYRQLRKSCFLFIAYNITHSNQFKTP